MQEGSFRPLLVAWMCSDVKPVRFLAQSPHDLSSAEAAHPLFVVFWSSQRNNDLTRLSFPVETYFKNKVWSCMPKMASQRGNIIYHKHMTILKRRVSLGKGQTWRCHLTSGLEVVTRKFRIFYRRAVISSGGRLSILHKWITSLVPNDFVNQFSLIFCGIIGSWQTEQGNVLYIHELVDSGEYFRIKNKVSQRTKVLPLELRSCSCGFSRLSIILRTQI